MPQQIPQQIVVVLVTPTPGEGSEQQGGEQQGDDQQGGDQQGQQSGGAQGESQGQPQNGQQEGQQSSEQNGQQGGAVAQAGGGSGGANEEELINQGEQIYNDNCASCHQPNGEGTSTYPALAGSAALTGEDPAEPINIVVNGRGQMPPFGGTLSAEQIAAVISYERNSWDNSAGVVTVEQVNQVMGGGSGASGGEQPSGEQQGGGQSEQGQPSEQQSGEQQSGDQQASQQASGGEQGQNQQQASGGQQGQSQQQTGSDVQIGQDGTITLRIEIAILSDGSATAQQPGAAQATSSPTPEATSESGGEAQATETPQPEQQGEGQTEQPAEGEAQEQTSAASESGEGNGNGGGDEQLISQGEQIYTSNCASCHQPSGEGTSAYPALAGSTVLTGEDPAEAIDIVVNGRGQMPPFGESLSAEEIAAVLSYERNSWDNSASTVSADQVNEVMGGGSASSGEQQSAEQQSGEQQATPAPEGGEEAAQGSGGEQQSSGEQGGEGSSQSAATVQLGEEGTVTLRIEVVVLPAGATPEQGQPAAQAAGTPQPDQHSQQAAQPEATESPTPEPTEEAAQASEESQEEQAQPESTQEESSQAEATPEAEAPATAEQGGEGDQAILQAGELVYAMNCANCHQLSGDGNTAYPPLNGSEIVTAEDPTAALLVILNGRGHMPAFAGLLSDEEIAAALSHERNSWSNNASTVSADQVQQAREGGGSPEQDQEQESGEGAGNGAGEESGESEGNGGEGNGEGSGEEEAAEEASAALPLNATQPGVEPVAFALRDRTNPAGPVAVAHAMGNPVGAPSGASPGASPGASSGPIEITIVLATPPSP